MARLFSSGFEVGSATSGMEWDTVAAATVVTSATFAPRTGTYVGRCNANTATAYFQHEFQLDAITTTFHRFYMNVQTLPAVTIDIFEYLDSASTIGFSLKLTSAGIVQMVNDAAGVTVLASSSAITTNTWIRVEVKVVDDAGTAGQMVLKLDGTTVASLTGLTGLNGGGLAAFGCVKTSSSALIYLDDVAINDSTGSFQNTYPGAGQIVHLVPNAAGDNNAFTVQIGGTAGAANNFTRVSEIPPDDATTYNGDALSGDIDDFNITDTPSSIASGDTINVVQVGVRYRAVVAAAEAAFKVRAKKAASGTVSSSAAITPNATTWKTNANGVPKISPLILYQDPDAGTITKSQLDNWQIGYTISTTNTNAADISAIWLLVDSTPVAAVVTGMIVNNFNPGITWIRRFAKNERQLFPWPFVQGQADIPQQMVMPIFNPGQTWMRRFGFNERRISMVPPPQTMQQYLMSLTANLGFVGVFTKITIRSLTGTLSFTGTFTKRLSRALAGTLNFSANLANKTIKALAGTLSFSGSQSKFITYPLTATLNFTTSFAKSIRRAIAGTLSFSGAFTASHLFVVALTATLSFVGTFSKKSLKSLTGTVSFVGTQTKALAKTAFTATLSFTGTSSKRTAKAITGSVSFIGSSSKNILKSLAANLSFIGSLSKSIRRALAGTVSFTGTFTKKTIRAVAGTLSFVGSMATQQAGLIIKSLTATLSFSSSFSKTTRKSLTANLSFIGTWARYMAATFVNMVTTIFSGNTGTSVESGNKVAEVSSGVIIDEVTTGTKNDEVTTGQKDTTVTSSRKNTEL